ncbi:MAG: carboxypeptidase regulatory-like domain-containing protein [Planctomycetota bacterium]
MRALLVALVLTLGLGAWWFLRAPGPDTPSGSNAAADAGALHSGDDAQDQPLTDDPEAAAVDAVDADRSNDTTRVAAPIALAAVPGRCVVHGRVVDADGAPIEGALVQLFAKRRWAKGSDAAPLAGGVPGAFALDGHVGYEATSDAAGRFALETAVPSSRRVQLHVARSAFHSVHTDRFTRGKDGAIVEGVRDLGDLELTAAGGLRGAVVGADAVGIAEARLELFLGLERAASLDAGEGGAFELGHLDPNRYVLRAEAPDCAREELPAVVVTAGAWTGPVELRLMPGPEIAGRVVDDAGTPLTGALVEAKRANEKTLARVESDAEGTFLARLPVRGDVTLDATLDGHEPARIDALATPATGLELVLRRRSRARIRVVDAASDEPIERFGVAVAAGAGSRAAVPHFVRRPSPREADHPGGTAEINGRIGQDLVLVSAPGYISAAADLGGAQWPRVDRVPPSGSWRAYAPDDGPFEQVIRMSRGARVRGTLAGEGWERASVSLTKVDERELRFRFVAKARRDAECSTEEPAFEFEGLEPGSWRLRATAEDGTTALVPVADLDVDETRDVGAVGLNASGTITGTVLLPPGAEVPSVTVLVADVPGLGAEQEPLAAATDAEGRFRIEGVPAGRRTVRNETIHTDLMWGGEVDALVPAGGEVDVTLDLTQRGLVPIEVTVELDGAPFDGAVVRVVREDVWPTRTAYDLYEDNEIYLGRTQFGGVARGRGRAFGRTRPLIEIDGWKFFAPEDQVIDLVGTATVEATVRLESGAIALMLPADAALPVDGSVRFRLESADDPRVASWSTVQLEGGAPIAHPGLVPGPDLRRWRAERLPPGEWLFSAEIHEQGAAERVHGAAEPERSEPTATYAASGTVSAGLLKDVRLERR